jgi:hypothetical protein
MLRSEEVARLASLLDDLDKLMAEIKAHPGEEALFSVIPAAAGAFLSRRSGGLGAPLGALLMGLGGIGAYQGLKASLAAPASGTITNSSIAPAGSTLSAAPGMTLGPPAPGAAAGPAAATSSSPAGIQEYLTHQGVPASVQPYMLHSHPSQYFPPPGTRHRGVLDPSRREPGCAHDVSLFPCWAGAHMSHPPASLQVVARDAGEQRRTRKPRLNRHRCRRSG